MILCVCVWHVHTYIYIYIWMMCMCVYVYIYYISHMDSRNHQMAPVSTLLMGSHFWGLALRNPRRKVNGQVPHCERCSPHKLSAVASCPLSCCVQTHENFTSARYILTNPKLLLHPLGTLPQPLLVASEIPILKPVQGLRKPPVRDQLTTSPTRIYWNYPTW